MSFPCVCLCTSLSVFVRNSYLLRRFPRPGHVCKILETLRHLLLLVLLIYPAHCASHAMRGDLRHRGGEFSCEVGSGSNGTSQTRVSHATEGGLVAELAESGITGGDMGVLRSCSTFGRV